jgi:cupin 2 domain-containing protein
MSNIFADIPGDLPEELETLLASGKAFTLKRIVSRGHCSPPDFWYDQAEAEWVILLSGEATVAFDHDRPPAQLKAGDYLYIPPHCRHRVSRTDPGTESVWLALYFFNDDSQT